MSQYDPPKINSNIFNDSYFTSIDGALTIQTADLRYLKLTGGVVRGDATFSSNLNVTNTLTVSTSLSTPIINSNQYLLAGASVLASALTSITPGTAAASKALVLDASSNIASIGTISQTVAAGGDVLSMSFTTASSRCSIKMNSDISNAEFGIRGSTAGSFPNSYYMYSNGSYKWVMSMSNGDTQVLSTTDSSSISSGALIVKGGLGVVKNIYCTGWLDLNRNGSNLNITNPSSGISGLIEVPASVNMLRLVRGFALNICSSGVTIENGSTRDARSVIDLGQTAANKQLGLFNNSVSYYGISANNSATQYSSGGGHVFYSSCSDASPINSKTLGIGSDGRVEFVNNARLGNPSYNNMIYLASTGTVLINSSSVQNSSNWLEVQGSSYFASNCGFGITSASYPIHVNASSSDNITSYGYINTSGSTGFVSGSSGTIFVGIKCANRIVSGEINLVSDRRIKKDITDITDEEALAFLSIRPVHYTLKKCGTKSYGYIAQDIMKNECFKDNRYILEDVISICPEPGVEQEIDDDLFLNPADHIYTVNYPKLLPLLHQIIKLQDMRIKKNTETIESLVSTVQFLKDLLSLRL